MWDSMMASIFVEICFCLHEQSEPEPSLSCHADMLNGQIM